MLKLVLAKKKKKKHNLVSYMLRSLVPNQLLLSWYFKEHSMASKLYRPIYFILIVYYEV